MFGHRNLPYLQSLIGYDDKLTGNRRWHFVEMIITIWGVLYQHMYWHFGESMQQNQEYQQLEQQKWNWLMSSLGNLIFLLDWIDSNVDMASIFCCIWVFI